MEQPLASSTPAISMHLYENEILGEVERLVDTTHSPRPVASGPSTRWRIYPLLLLAVCGAAFALAQVDVKDALLTGRSVAHALTP